jgi:hypothetical protein
VIGIPHAPLGNEVAAAVANLARRRRHHRGAARGSASAGSPPTNTRASCGGSTSSPRAHRARSSSGTSSFPLTRGAGCDGRGRERSHPQRFRGRHPAHPDHRPDKKNALTVALYAERAARRSIARNASRSRAWCSSTGIRKLFSSGNDIADSLNPAPHFSKTEPSETPCS